MTLRAVDHRVLAREGERESGDAVLVRREGDSSLIAVVDALGHGEKAAHVARVAIEVASAQRVAAGVLPAMKAVHEALSGTRGACALLCIVTPAFVEVCSVGNVELRVSGMQLPFMLTAGVLGSRMVRPRVIRAPIEGNGRLVMYSDGLSSRFHLPDFASLSSADACRAIFERHRRAHDDAALVVADIGGDMAG